MVNVNYNRAVDQREHGLETQIRRFAKGYRRRLRKLVKSSSRLGDLLYTFPAAAFALVSGRGDHTARVDTVRLVKDGASLQRVGRILDLPAWTRRLPPEAFVTPLGDLPNSPDFNRQVVNLIPRDSEATAMWLIWLQSARAACHEEFALWLAAQNVYSQDTPFVGVDDVAPILPLAAFAWFSGQADEPARRMIERPWHRRMGFAAAVHTMSGWFDRVLLDLTRADQRHGPGRYSRRKNSKGLILVQLATAEALREEGEAMNNCVATYAPMVANGRCRIYSVRHRGRRLATLEIVWPHDRIGRPTINQLLGHSNTVVDRKVYVAVSDWLEQNEHLVCRPPVLGAIDCLDSGRWRWFWQNYIAEMGDESAVQVDPDGRLMERLCRDVASLTDCVRT
ncbi:MAG: PcfJ domain-containing protein [Hyphomicrobiaceae bacterium]